MTFNEAFFQFIVGAKVESCEISYGEISTYYENDYYVRVISIEESTKLVIQIYDPAGKRIAEIEK